MEIRILRYFLAVVKAQNIVGAAKMLHITQPTLSRQLMDMEEELGCKLFKRSNRTITLTPEGLFLYKRAEEIISLVDKTADQFNKTDEIISGKITIGCAETETMRCLAQTIKELQSQHPQIQFQLISGNIEDISDKIDSGVFDFGVFCDVVDSRKYNYLRLPKEERWGVLMRKDHPLAGYDEITPPMLWDKLLIFSGETSPGSTLFSSKLAGWMEKDLGDLNITATYNLLYNASILVEEGLGCAICFDRLLNLSGESKLCFRPLAPKLTSTIYFIWKKNQLFTRQAALFLAQMQQHLAKEKAPISSKSR